MTIQVAWVATAEEALGLKDQGFCPVECSFGGSVVVDHLTMDHHGEWSHLDGVALRAYRDHFGARRMDPRFVVTGAADADACFAIAALAGLLPHPSRETELQSAPPPVKASGTRDLSALADLVNRADLSVTVRLEEEEGGETLLLWKQLASPSQDALAFYGGVERWRLLLGRPLASLLQASKAQEVQRVNAARQARVQRFGKVALVESSVPGFDVWYSELAPCIVALTPQGNITLGCQDVPTAERLFGDGGLKRVYNLLGQGWGGRETVGGSPRGQRMTLDDAQRVAQVIADQVQPA